MCSVMQRDGTLCYTRRSASRPVASPSLQGSNDARTLSSADEAWGSGQLGHAVRLMPPAYVKPYLKRGKIYAADAAAPITPCLGSQISKPRVAIL